MPQEVQHPIGDEDSRRYGELLTQIKVRMEPAGIFLDQQPPTYFSIESAALQLRQSIELVALGSLITNRAHAEKMSSAFHTKDWNEARKVVRTIPKSNPAHSQLMGIT